jgi:D-glycero-D-manno-heptose 1,7-bisphosphate phosphatase
MSSSPGIILDRDGTLIDVVRDEETGVISVAFHPSHIRLLPGVISGLLALKREGFVFAIATNQPGPAKGTISVDAVQRTHHALLSVLADHGIHITALEVCWHHPTGGPDGVQEFIGDCKCRKPKPGLLKKAIEDAALDPRSTWMIGDSPGDVEAARAAKVRSALVFSEKRCELCPLKSGPPLAPDLQAATFDEVARKILAAPRVVC